jgi:hypothetical protein
MDAQTGGAMDRRCWFYSLSKKHRLTQNCLQDSLHMRIQRPNEGWMNDLAANGSISPMNDNVTSAPRWRYHLESSNVVRGARSSAASSHSIERSTDTESSELLASSV